jgi:hypothetical protein
MSPHESKFYAASKTMTKSMSENNFNMSTSNIDREKKAIEKIKQRQVFVNMKIENGNTKYDRI